MATSQNSQGRKTVLMLGCFDSKTEDFNYLYACLTEMDVDVLSINTGSLGTTDAFEVDYEVEVVAAETDMSIEELRESKDRGLVVEKMGEGAAKIIAKLVREKKFDGAIGMGGGGGTYIALSAMQAIPIGVPKFCLSTLASKDLSRQVGTKDITLMPSVVDVAGLNSISRLLIRQAAGAIAGMVKASDMDAQATKGNIAISMFGNTTACVQQCTELLKKEGYDVLAFHAVGVGGRTMEALITDGFFDAVLDLTTTELADDLCDGICSAGPERLTAAAKAGIPQVVAPGCLDMVNYGHVDTVPERYKDRLLYSWAPDVTLMRTNEAENKTLAATMAHRLNQSSGDVAVLIPKKGISIVSSEGGIFHKPGIDKVLFDTLKTELKEGIPISELEVDINHESFARLAVDTVLEMLDGDARGR